MSELPIVLVTGASGFIATHVVSILLAEKKYRVRGTVRDANNEKSTKPLKDAFPELELVSADLNKDDGWKEAVAGCTYVHHLASHPFENPRDRNELIRPAVDGTKRVLEACAEAGTVKRVILTSSIAAISTGYLGNEDKPHDHVYTPDDWTNPDSQRCPAYEASKTYAEKAAWEFVEKLEGDKKFELITIHPVAVFGPLILPKVSASHGFILMLLKRQVPSVPDIGIPFVDVRDVAKAHVAAMTRGTPGQRYILYTDTKPLRDIAHILADKFNPQGYRVPVSKMWKITLWIGKLFDKKAELLYAFLGSHLKFDNSQVKELGVELIGLKKSLMETAYSLIEHEIVPKMAGFKGEDQDKDE
ncbi:uncharacterized protein [Oscarella lobularis]|uniref:uncharacterized protein isoform X2 n=1 Tax=Oscarella lobularis TaxID=121494 RepID=UPI00331358FC